MPGTVADMTQDFATAAVELARELDVTLDYSEDSLQLVEQILAQLHDEVQNSNTAASANSMLAGSPPPTGPDPEQMKEMCKLWGSYFGEVVRRRWGGDWSIESYPGGEFATLTLTVGAGKIFPSMKVYRRLTEGAQDNVWDFYQQIRKKFAAAPGSAVQ